jgi:hypothetical protein
MAQAQTGQEPPEALGVRERFHRRPPLRGDEVPQGLPVFGDEGVHVDQVSDSLWNPVGDPGDHRPA